MNENMVFSLCFFPSLAVVLIFTMKYLAAIFEANVRKQQDGSYRELAATSSAALAAQGATLADIQMRLINLEKILQEVE